MCFPFPNATVFQCWAKSFLLVVGVRVSLRDRHSAQGGREECLEVCNACFLLCSILDRNSLLGQFYMTMYKIHILEPFPLSSVPRDHTPGVQRNLVLK